MDMKREILTKVEKAKQSLAAQKAKNSELLAKRQSLDESVKKTVSQNQKARE